MLVACFNRLRMPIGDKRYCISFTPFHTLTPLEPFPTHFPSHASCVYSQMYPRKTQLQEREQQRADELREMAKPFARHADDTDMNQLLKEEIRADDPMAAYMLKQREKAIVASGRTVRPKYKGPWPSNRYNIPPGYRWDGRDRSNGFEKKLMLYKNKASATKKDAYRWSSENM
eukprot:m.91530 g.91530  ORF g.91530 m.91530 type:complete len:173 (+) comp16494_c0_seq2:542-1060(+)